MNTWRAKVVDVGGLRWRVHPGVDPSPFWSVLEDPEAHLSDPARYLKHEAVVTVARVPAPLPGQPDLVLRRLNYGKPMHRLRDLLRPTRVLRALRHGWRLEAAGVPTPRALAAAEVRRFRWPVIAYLITEEVPGAVTLARHFEGRRQLSRVVVQRLAAAVSRLHQAGYSHRDLQGTNVLLDRELHPWVIDLDGLRRAGWFAHRRQVSDLARLGRDFLGHPRVLKWTGCRFLRDYCRKQGRDAEFCRLARAIAFRLAAKMARLARSGR
jgi:tRNA A-37 threonylcarbamoyl transferase component Bud32